MLILTITILIHSKYKKLKIFLYQTLLKLRDSQPKSSARMEPTGNNVSVSSHELLKIKADAEY